MKRSTQFSITAGLLFAVPAFAYVPPIEYSVAQMLKKRSSLKTLRVRTRIKGDGKTFKETLWYESAGKRIRAKIFDEADQLLFSYEKKGIGSRFEATSLMFENHSNNFLGLLKANGFAVGEANVTNDKPLGRVKSLLGWIYAGRRQEMWIQKDEFTVLKWVNEESGKTEVNFEDTRYSRDLPYPRMISLLQDGTEKLTGEAIEVTLNPDLSDLKTQVFAPKSEPDSEVLRLWLKWIR
ncbi:MAG: hypothetical protein EOP09_18855 [Proteobacteria bacterium]|nr:MAG: hypothetical protein EOP09_18855 [Pseudomonadota bacterium]